MQNQAHAGPAEAVYFSPLFCPGLAVARLPIHCLPAQGPLRPPRTPPILHPSSCFFRSFLQKIFSSNTCEYLTQGTFTHLIPVHRSPSFRVL